MLPIYHTLSAHMVVEHDYTNFLRLKLSRPQPPRLRPLAVSDSSDAQKRLRLEFASSHVLRSPSSVKPGTGLWRVHFDHQPMYRINDNAAYELQRVREA